jgi:hypothetical protein
MDAGRLTDIDRGGSLGAERSAPCVRRNKRGCNFFACCGGGGGSVPNVLRIDPLRALAKRASDRIADKAVAARYERLAFDRLLRDPRTYRPAQAEDLEDAPDWARRAEARGEPICVFKNNRALAARMHSVARRLADTCKLAAAEPAQHPDDATTIQQARAFLAKFDRVNFDTAARKSLVFSRVLTLWEDQADAIQVCEPRIILLLSGRSWHRLTSVKQLRATGREFLNCLARTRRTGGYGAMLLQGQAQFWVLRAVGGKGLIVAMAPLPVASHFVEVKGPRNAHVSMTDADLVQLGLVIGVPDPPTAPLPSATSIFDEVPAGLRALLDQLDPSCRCNLCVPHSRGAPVRLRPRARLH